MTTENIALDARLVEEIRSKVAPESGSVQAFIEAAVRQRLREETHPRARRDDHL